MTELEMYELWRTLRLWANYNQLNQTIEKNWLSNSFNSHILDLLDKEEIKYRSEKRLLGYRNKGKRRLAGNANQPIIINIDDVADVIDVRAEDEFARVELLAALVGQVIMASIWAYNAHHAYFNTFPPQATAVIYDTRRGMERLIGKYGLDAKYKVVSTATAGECIENLSMLDGISTVFLSGIHSHDRNIILKYCVENNITVFVVPRIGDTIMSGAHHMHMFHLPMLRVGRYNPQPEYLLVKRLLDIVISAIALVILSPIFLVTAIAIKATDHGPVFYKQIRLTKDGKEFGILKFRSMRVDAEKDGVARLSSGENDDRITPVGKIIRACRVDELPQLINILKGDLSIVGPRPERPEIAAQYCEEMPEFSLRLQAKAGLTGYAQVYGKYNTTPYDKLTMDLMYIAHPSIVEDLKIMFATVKILFMPESTEGVSEGQTTAMSGENN